VIVINNFKKIKKLKQSQKIDEMRHDTYLKWSTQC